MSRPRSRTTGPQLLRLLAVLATLLAAAVLLAAPASAHAALIRTDPANGAVLAQAPEEVRLTFNEPVRLTAEAVRLFDATGSPAPVEAVVRTKAVVVDLPEGLEDGTHVLGWRVISYDGHPLSGNLTFSIGNASAGAVAVPTGDGAGAGTRRIASIVQGFQYVGLLLAAGLVVFTVLLPPQAPRAAYTRLLRVMRAAALVAAGAGVGLVALASVQGLRPGLLGRESVAALLVAVGLLGAVLACRRPPARGARVLALLGAALAVTAPALVGHTRSFGPEALLVVVDVTHLVTGAIWFGGLVGLVLTLRLLAGDLGARVLSRFSTLAAGSLVVLVAMGILLSWRILSSWENLFTTAYGALLLTKIAIVVVAVLVATVNRFVLLPRVSADAHTEDGRAPRTRPIRTAIAAEGALLAVALLVTGFLSGQAPHPTEDVQVMSAAPVSRTTTVGDVRVEVSLASRVVGLNTLRIQTRASAHGHHGEAAAPVVRLSSEDLDLGAVPLERTSPTTYEARVVLPDKGVWDVQVGIRLDEFENPVSTVEFNVAAAGEARG